MVLVKLATEVDGSLLSAWSVRNGSLWFFA